MASPNGLLSMINAGRENDLLAYALDLMRRNRANAQMVSQQPTVSAPYMRQPRYSTYSRPPMSGRANWGLAMRGPTTADALVAQWQEAAREQNMEAMLNEVLGRRAPAGL